MVSTTHSAKKKGSGKRLQVKSKKRTCYIKGLSFNRAKSYSLVWFWLAQNWHELEVIQHINNVTPGVPQKQNYVNYLMHWAEKFKNKIPHYFVPPTSDQR